MQSTRRFDSFCHWVALSLPAYFLKFFFSFFATIFFLYNIPRVLISLKKKSFISWILFTGESMWRRHILQCWRFIHSATWLVVVTNLDYGFAGELSYNTIVIGFRSVIHEGVRRMSSRYFLWGSRKGFIGDAGLDRLPFIQ